MGGGDVDPGLDGDRGGAWRVRACPRRVCAPVADASATAVATRVVQPAASRPDRRPTRPAADFAAKATAFNDSTTPIVFNPYDISAGQKLLFGNEAAQRFLGTGEGETHAVPGRGVPPLPPR